MAPYKNIRLFPSGRLGYRADGRAVTTIIWGGSYPANMFVHRSKTIHDFLVRHNGGKGPPVQVVELGEDGAN